jgi:dipeptidyl aminopeptidase/acylaminoacyl peptidase
VADPDGNGAYVDPRPLQINSYGDESSPAMSPDGRHLIFQAYRGTKGFGEQDLYASERTEYGWSEPWLLPEPVNSARNDGYPSFSPDGTLFFFSSDRGEGFYDIYVVEVEALELN